MDINKLNQGEKIAAGSAIALLLIMFIFNWFGVEGFDGGFNAWESFGFIDIILFISVLIAVGGAVVTASSQSVNTPVAISAVTTIFGVLCVLLVLFRIIDPPGGGEVDTALGSVDVPDATRKIGVFLGLIASAGIAAGGWMAMQEEGVSFQGEADRLQGGGGGTPPPPPPPPPQG